MTEPLLQLDSVTTYYGQMRILEGISLQVGSGELICLLGGNASGKSTTLKTILGIVQPRSGRVVFDGKDVTSWPVPQRIGGGMAIVPENRRLFGDMTVRENLELGAVLRRGESLDDDFDRIHVLFPRLLERRSQLAGTLSGGEQQMLAISRALVTGPEVLLMDELSMGLAPLIVGELYDLVGVLAQQGITVLLVEQFVTTALTVATHAAIMVHGRIQQEGTPQEMSEAALNVYLA
jgi:branched-chain amino acid transport system ATP-binding protein